MMRYWWPLLWLCLAGAPAVAQATSEDAPGKSGSLVTEEPEANPGRPTVSTPATLTPVGYFQFETGVFGAWTSPEFSSQFNFNEVIKFSVSRWIELVAEAEPYEHAYAGGQFISGTGGLSLGAQAILHHGEGANPTVAAGYL